MRFVGLLLLLTGPVVAADITGGITKAKVVGLAGTALDDFSVTAPQTNQVLTWNGTKWIASAATVSSPWVTQGSTIYYQTGRVLIGTSTHDGATKLKGNGTD